MPSHDLAMGEMRKRRGLEIGRWPDFGRASERNELDFRPLFLGQVQGDGLDAPLELVHDEDDLGAFLIDHVGLGDHAEMPHQQRLRGLAYHDARAHGKYRDQGDEGVDHVGIQASAGRVDQLPHRFHRGRRGNRAGTGIERCDIGIGDRGDLGVAVDVAGSVRKGFQRRRILAPERLLRNHENTGAPKGAPVFFAG